MNLVAIDIETTGLRADRDLITEVAVVRFTETGQVLSEYASLVRAIPLDDHGYPADPLTRIHGIQPTALYNAPSWADEVAYEVAERIDGTVLVGHNARRFDWPFINAALRRVGIAIDAPTIIDTLDRDRRYRQNANRHRLVDACAAWGIPLDPHRALADTRATMALALRQAAVVGWAA